MKLLRAGMRAGVAPGLTGHLMQRRLRPNLAAVRPNPSGRKREAQQQLQVLSCMRPDQVTARRCAHFSHSCSCTCPRMQRAQAAFSAALDINSQDGETYQRRGEQQLLLGDLDAAIADYRLAVRLQPRSAGLRPALWRQPPPPPPFVCATL